MSFFDLRILITQLVSSNSSKNNRITYTLDVHQRFFSMRINIRSSLVGRRQMSSGWLVRGGGGGFIRYNKQFSYFRLKKITKLVIGYCLNIFAPLSTPSLFLLSPLSLSMSLFTCPPVHLTILLLYSWCQFFIDRGCQSTRKCCKYPILFTLSRYTCTPCHGQKSSHQIYRFYPLTAY